MKKQLLCGCTEIKPCAEHVNRNSDTNWRDADTLLQTGVGRVPGLRSCILRHPGCDGLTAGSVGAASGVLRAFMCPSCASVEDGALLTSLRNQGRVMDEALVEVLAPTPLATEVTS